MTPLGRDLFDAATAERRLAAYFGVATSDGFGAFSRARARRGRRHRRPMSRSTQVGERPPLSPPQREAAADIMVIDAATRVNLEIAARPLRRAPGQPDRRHRPHRHRRRRPPARRPAVGPSTDPAVINARLDAVAWMRWRAAICGSSCAGALEAAPDIERALSRLALGRGGPRDLAALARGLTVAAALAEAVAASGPTAEIRRRARPRCA